MTTKMLGAGRPNADYYLDGALPPRHGEAMRLVAMLALALAAILLLAGCAASQAAAPAKTSQAPRQRRRNLA
jgi:hypothetical protein